MGTLLFMETTSCMSTNVCMTSWVTSQRISEISGQNMKSGMLAQIISMQHCSEYSGTGMETAMEHDKSVSRNRGSKIHPHKLESLLCYVIVDPNAYSPNGNYGASSPKFSFQT